MIFLGRGERWCSMGSPDCLSLVGSMQLPEKYKENFWCFKLETLKFSLYFSSSCIPSKKSLLLLALCTLDSSRFITVLSAHVYENNMKQYPTIRVRNSCRQFLVVSWPCRRFLNPKDFACDFWFKPKFKLGSNWFFKLKLWLYFSFLCLYYI